MSNETSVTDTSKKKKNGVKTVPLIAWVIFVLFIVVLLSVGIVRNWDRIPVFFRSLVKFELVIRIGFICLVFAGVVIFAVAKLFGRKNKKPQN